MSALRIGCVEYVNALPFYLPFLLKHIDSPGFFTFANPHTLNTMLKEKKLDLALTSSVEYLDGNYHMLRGFGIAAWHSVLSVNLYTCLPLASLKKGKIGISHHSASSSALLKVLCRHYWKIDPQFEILDRKKPLSEYTAFLLIGNEALEKQSIAGFKTIDLASVWYEMTHLPFVFAVFSARKEVDRHKIDYFKKQLDHALKWSDANREIIEKEAMQQCCLEPSLTKTYFNLLKYRINKKEIEGLEIFKKLKKEIYV